MKEFLKDPYLRDIVERNLEVAAQCCIDIANRIISIEEALKPADYYQSFLRLGEIGVLPMDFARRFAPIAGFRNVLVHEYPAIDWNEVYALAKPGGLICFFGANPAMAGPPRRVRGLG